MKTFGNIHAVIACRVSKNGDIVATDRTIQKMDSFIGIDRTRIERRLHFPKIVLTWFKDGILFVPLKLLSSPMRRTLCFRTQNAQGFSDLYAPRRGFVAFFCDTFFFKGFRRSIMLTERAVS